MDKEVEVERCYYDWIIPDFGRIFSLINQKTTQSETSETTRRHRSRRQDSDGPKVELHSEKFIRGQFVNRTALWQLELRKNRKCLSVGLSCLQCFDDEVTEIWTKFDTDIVDLDGKCIHSVPASEHYAIGNETKFTPKNKMGDKRDSSVNYRCSTWEMDMIRLETISGNWDTLVGRGILKLRLRLHIYQQKPFNEVVHFSSIRDTVGLRYTDCSLLASTSPLLQAVRNLWDTKDGADVAFSVEGNLVLAHKFVVTLQSSFLGRKLEETRRENENNANAAQLITEIPNVSRSSFQQVLKFLYTQDPEEIKATTDINWLSDILDTCNYLGVHSLAKTCLVRLLTNMNVDNFAETANVIYEKVSLQQSFFKNEVKKFFLENQETLRTSNDFKQKMLQYRNMFIKLCLELQAI